MNPPSVQPQKSTRIPALRRVSSKNSSSGSIQRSTSSLEVPTSGSPRSENTSSGSRAPSPRNGTTPRITTSRESSPRLPVLIYPSGSEGVTIQELNHLVSQLTVTQDDISLIHTVRLILIKTREYVGCQRSPEVYAFAQQSYIKVAELAVSLEKKGHVDIAYQIKYILLEAGHEFELINKNKKLALIIYLALNDGKYEVGEQKSTLNFQATLGARRCTKDPAYHSIKWDTTFWYLKDCCEGDAPGIALCCLGKLYIHGYYRSEKSNQEAGISFEKKGTDPATLLKRYQFNDGALKTRHRSEVVALKEKYLAKITPLIGNDKSKADLLAQKYQAKNTALLKHHEFECSKLYENYQCHAAALLEKSQSEAAILFIKSAMCGYQPAIAMLNSMGTSDSSLSIKALALLNIAEMQKNSEASFLLGELYLHGDAVLGIDKNEEKAMEHFKVIVDQLRAELTIPVIERVREGKPTFFIDGARIGNIAFMLAEFYSRPVENKKFVTQLLSIGSGSESKISWKTFAHSTNPWAFRYLTIAADAGHNDAMQYCLMAAHKNHSEAITYLKSALEVTDNLWASFWITAAGQHYPGAREYIAMAAIAGDTGSAHYFLKTAKEGNLDDQEVLKVAADKENSVAIGYWTERADRNDPEAIRYLQMAAGTNNCLAMNYWIAAANADKKIALDFLLTAANYSHKMAIYFWHSALSTKNAKAADYLQSIATSGNQDAINILKTEAAKGTSQALSYWAKRADTKDPVAQSFLKQTIKPKLTAAESGEASSLDFLLTAANAGIKSAVRYFHNAIVENSATADYLKAGADFGHTGAIKRWTDEAQKGNSTAIDHLEKVGNLNKPWVYRYWKSAVNNNDPAAILFFTKAAGSGNMDAITFWITAANEGSSIARNYLYTAAGNGVPWATNYLFTAVDQNDADAIAYVLLSAGSDNIVMSGFLKEAQAAGKPWAIKSVKANEVPKPPVKK